MTPTFMLMMFNDLLARFQYLEVCKALNGFLYGFRGMPLVYCQSSFSIGFNVF